MSVSWDRWPPGSVPANVAGAAGTVDLVVVPGVSAAAPVWLAAGPCAFVGASSAADSPGFVVVPGLLVMPEDGLVRDRLLVPRMPLVVPKEAGPLDRSSMGATLALPLFQAPVQNP